MLRASCFVLAASALAATASAQTMRTFTVSRQFDALPTLAVGIEFGAGRLALGPSRNGLLYEAVLRYDQERATPEHRYDAHAHRLDLGLRALGNLGSPVVNRDQLGQNASISLTPTIPITLDVTLGAGEGDIDLGGLRLRGAAIHLLASRTVIHASRPNVISCEALDLNGGAAEVITEKLGNLRCAEIRFDGGAGRTTLDLTGEWSSALRVRAKQALGSLQFVLPKDAGVQIVLDQTLTTFKPVGFVRSGNTWVTPNFRSATRTIQIDVTTAVGGLEVSWQ